MKRLVAMLVLFPSIARGDDVTAPMKWRPRPALEVDGGWSPHELLGISTSGADVGLGANVRVLRHLAIGGTFRGTFGATTDGLSVTSWSFAPRVEGVVGRFRIGLGGGGLVLGVQRALRDDLLVGSGLFAQAAARVDVVRTEHLVLFLRAAVDAGTAREIDFRGATFGGGFDFGPGG